MEGYLEVKNEEICSGVCTGCFLCEEICPTNAIDIKEDKRGFYSPVIDPKKCIDCKLCQKFCNLDIEMNEIKNSFIAKHKREDVYLKSQSGGAFSAISDFILKNKGVIYGAGFDKEFKLSHLRATDIIERNKMRGSKYSQSSMEGIYRKIEKDLKEGMNVLFSGTPCQVAGIKRFVLGKKIDDSNLYLIDILCHGVPSNFILKEFIKNHIKKYNQKLDKIFLKAEKGIRPTFYFKFGNNIVSDYLYRKLYYSNLALRDSCYNCSYCKISRVGDFTIGDAWGVEKSDREFYNSNGVSLILANTDKGVRILNFIKKEMELKEVNIECYKQECLLRSAKPKRSPVEFWNDYDKRSFDFIVNKYAKHNIFLNIKYIFLRVKNKILGGK